MGFIQNMVARAQAAMQRANQEAEEARAAFVLELNDPVALATSFTPLAPGGASFRTHVLASPAPDRLAFHLTVGSRLFFGVFPAIGVMLFLLAPIVGVATVGGGDLLPVIVLTALGALFTAVGTFLMRASSRPVILDLTRGTVQTTRDPAAAKPLAGVHAVQIIRERVSGDKSSFHSYEINLVWADGTRLNLVDHGKLRAVQQDAATLAERLGVPVWDASAL